MTTTPAVRLELPFPPEQLNPNRLRRLHWGYRKKYMDQYRTSVALLAKSERVSLEADGLTFPLPAPVRATLTFVLTTRRRIDYVNLYAAFKAGEDGLVDAGLLSDDNVWVYTPTLDAVLGKQRAVIVTLEAA